jgi:hypothetical protein
MPLRRRCPRPPHHPSVGPSFGWEAKLPGKREMIVAYRTARERAQRSTTARLRDDERRARDDLTTTITTTSGCDDVALARLTAVRDELQARGVDVPSLTPDLVGARR